MVTDGTLNQADPEAKPASSAAEGTSIGGTDGTYTKAQLEATVRKAVNDALAAAGRDAKTLSQKQADIDRRAAEVAAAEAEVERTRREAAEAEGPEALSAHDREVRARKALAEANRLKEQADAVMSEAQALKSEKVARELASEYDVDPELLLSLGDGSKEKMTALAKALPKAGKVTSTLKTDSGVTTGGGSGFLTRTQIVEMQSEIARENDPAKRALIESKLDAAWRTGRIRP